MSFGFFRFVLALGVCLAALFPPPPASAFEIFGQVTDVEGKPFPRARVELAETRLGYEQGLRWVAGERLPEPVAATVTDAHGAYRIEAPGPGLWRLVVSAPGYIPMERGPEAFVVDEQVAPVALVADAGVSVTVTDRDGSPLPGARVWFGRSDDTLDLWSHAHQGRWRPVYHPEIADDRGRVRLSRREGEILNLRAWAPGYLESPLAATNGQAVRFELSPGVLRTLEIRDSRDDPVEGVLVRRGLNGWTVAATDEHGRALAAFPKSEKSMVRLDSGDGRWAAYAVPPPAPDVEPDAPDVQVVPLPDARVARGVVTDASTGEPVPGALVWFGGDGRFQRADARGAFELRFAGVDETLSVQAVAPGYALARTNASLEEDHPLELDLTLKPAFQILGRVVDATGEPLADVDVWWREKNEWDLPWAPFQKQRRVMRTGRDGMFRIGFLRRDGSWEIRAEADGYAPREVQVAASDASEIVDVVLEAGHTLVGRVVGPEGEPVSGATLHLYGVSPGRERFVRLAYVDPRQAERTTVTAEDGRFELRHLSAGRFALTAEAPGYASRLWTGIETHEEVVDRGDLILERGRTISGRVVDRNGSPVTGAEVLLGSGALAGRLLDSEARWGTRNLRTGADGTFRFGELTPGETYVVAAKKEGLAPVLVDEVRAVSEASEPPLELVLEPGSAVFGVVLDPRGRPLEGVDVQLVRETSEGSRTSQSISGSMKSRADGDWRFEDVPAGRFVVRAPLAQASRPADGESVELEEGRELGPIRLIREAEAKIDGRVVTSDGRPVARAKVVAEVSADASERYGASRSVTQTTDAAGRFRLEGLPPGVVHLVAEHAEHGRVERTVETTPGSNELELSLRQTARIDGRVVDDLTDAPVSGARITLVPEPPGSTTQGFVSAEADAEGRFVLRPPAGSYTLKTWAPDYVEHTVPDPLEVTDRSVDRVLVRLDTGTTFTGRITGLEPAELGRVSVLAQPMPGRGRMLEGDVSSDGRYRISGAQPGAWTLHARVEDPMRHVQETATVEAGERDVVVDLDFTDGYSLIGRVAYNDEPAVGARVTLLGLDGDGRWLSQQTDYRGAFRFGSLEAGRYRMTVFVGDAVQEIREIDLVTDEEVDIDLRGGAVVGRVVAEDGRPVSDAEISLQGRNVGWSSGRMVTLRTDAQGRFELDRVGEGTYRLLVRAPAGTATRNVEVGSTRIDLGDVNLERGEEVVLAVRGPSGVIGRPVVGLVRNAAGQVLVTVEGRIGEEGLATLRGIPAEGREMFVSVDPFVPVRMTLGHGPGPHPVTLLPAGRLFVRVRDESPGEAARMRLVDAAGRPPVIYEMIPGTENGIPGYQGQFAIPVLAPGTWTVTVTAADGRVWSREIAVTPGDATEVVLE